MAHRKKATKVSKAKRPQYIVLNQGDETVIEDDKLRLFDSEQDAIDYVTENGGDIDENGFEVTVLEVTRRSLWEIEPETGYHAVKIKTL